MSQPAQVTAAEISRLAGVTRATVSNWRRRHPDFPAPTGGTETSPAYDLAQVRAWLSARGQWPTSSAVDELRVALRATTPGPDHRSRLLPLVVAASRVADSEPAKAAELSDKELSTWAGQTVRAHAADLPDGDRVAYRPADAELLRPVLRCLTETGAATTIDVLTEIDSHDATASGQYDTPAALAALAADLLAGPDTAYPEKIFDPACGTGGLLLAAAARGATALHGQDIVPLVAVEAAARLAVQAPQAAAQVRAGDSLHADAFAGLVADAALCAPPYGDRSWGHEELAGDPRWVFGLPARNESELAWLQHCYSHLPPGGRAVLVMPPGAAVRPSGRRIRAELVRSGALRAVIALPAGAAPPLHIGLQLWIVQQPQPEAGQPSTVLMVDTDGRRAPNRPTHTSDDSPGRRTPPEGWAEAALTAWRAFERDPAGFAPEPGVSLAVAVVDLLDETVDLTPARHVRAAPVPADPGAVAKQVSALHGRMRQAAATLAAHGDDAPWQPTGDTARTWRTAAVADLLRGGALTLLRPPVTPRDTAAHPDDEIIVEAGDVLLPELLNGPDRAVRVADADDAGTLLDRRRLLLRPDPQRLDPWFLAGFLAAEDNLSAAATGSTIVRVDPRRLRVPLLPLAEQQRYGRAFRRIDLLRRAAQQAGSVAEETARTLSAGLTGGALLPTADPDRQDEPQRPS
ncbi:N-6 DNA methylase [Solwaraspora sp. WMMD792]|uniref:N-6 DNA methylase n=1 Tax=Solwaraspora sp. WMMD792 TaxID=3016099 RepID=UPI002416FA0E|nr:N-6 DNA methylase [Solwaraspora sp. WMMD792]MDG4774971.1 N-6 DNA methylase [Solwaraspora sp. WMMD792]